MFCFSNSSEEIWWKALFYCATYILKKIGKYIITSWYACKLMFFITLKNESTFCTILYYILCQTKLASTKLVFLMDRSCVKERWWWKLSKYYIVHKVFLVKKDPRKYKFIINLVNTKISVQKSALQIDKP